MALTFEQKKALVTEVTDVVSKANAAIVAEYRGLSVSQMTNLRSEARKNGVYVRVLKNTLAKRVVEGSEFECLNEHFIGPIVLAVSEDPVAVAKVFDNFDKNHEKFLIKAGAMNGALMNEAQIKALAKLPSRDELLAKLLGTMQAPIAKFVQTLNEVPGKFVRTLDAYRESKEAA